MRGTFFQKPIEYRLEVKGESWKQGETIYGALSVKNHGGDPLDKSDIGVHLAIGDLKQVRLKSNEAFEILSSTFFKDTEDTLDWHFEISRNSPITDKSGSLFLLYGKGATQRALGQLQLQVQPHPLIQEFIDRFQVQYRFVVKGLKAGKHGVEAKLAPPSGKTFATLDHAIVSAKFDDDALGLRYVFNIKKVDTAAAGFEVAKAKREVTQTIAPNEYRTASGRFNQDLLEQRIKEALGVVEAKIF